jgi:hypothetical protein
MCDEGTGMNTTKFHYAILRYIHDIVSGEFVNMGIVMATENGSVLARFARDFRRIERVFPTASRSDIKRKVRHISRTMSKRNPSTGTLKKKDSDALLMEITSSLLPPDDSSLQFTAANGGMTSDIQKQLESLFLRIVDESHPHRIAGAKKYKITCGI